MQALLYRAQALNLISKAEAGWLWRQFNTSRIKLREPPELDFAVERPGVVNRMIDLHLSTLGFTEVGLAEFFHINEDMYKTLYPLHKPGPMKGIQLRVVR